MNEIKMYVVMSGQGKIYGPFKTADEASTFLSRTYHEIKGHSRIECVWSTAIWDERDVSKAA